MGKVIVALIGGCVVGVIASWLVGAHFWAGFAGAFIGIMAIK